VTTPKLAPPPRNPQQVRILVGARGQHLAVDCDQFDGAEAVDAEAVGAACPADGAAKRRPRDAVVDDGAPGDVVPAAANGDGEITFAGEPERSRDVVCRFDPDDCGGESVDAAVPDRPRFVVVVVTRDDDGSGDGAPEVGRGRRIDEGRDRGTRYKGI